MNIDWAKRKARRLIELSDKIASKAGSPAVVAWHSEVDEINDLMRRYDWQVNPNGTVSKRKDT